MPVHETFPRSASAKQEPIEKFTLISEQAISLNVDFDICMALRKQAIKDYEEMCGFQKSIEDREYKRFFSQEASDRLKLCRAYSLVLPYLIDNDFLPKDCKTTDTFDWPPELWPSISLVLGAIEVAHCHLPA